MTIVPQDFSPGAYAAQLRAKQRALAQLLAEFAAPPLAVHASPPRHYRQRAEFRAWHEGDDLHYLMYRARGEPLRVDDFPPASRRINELMRALRVALREAPELKRRLFQVEFLATLAGAALVTLVYHRRLDDTWLASAHEMQARLGASLIGRSRGQRLVAGEPFVTELLDVAGRRLEYRQPEACFTQPNAEVNRAMLAWAMEAGAGMAQTDLVELYCGIGNFTVALAPQHRRVLATEIDTTAIGAARHNLAANGVRNCFVARLSSAEAAAALARERPFRRLVGFDLDDFHPRALLVDPPRAGLDERTLRLAAGFERIVYVSCNPHTLAANLRALGGAFRIERCAMFDQFPYTPHIECGVVLERIR